MQTTFSLTFGTLGIDGISNIFDLKTQQIIHKIEAHALPARSNVFSPNGALLYTASDDRHVSVYDTKSGRVIQSFSHPGMTFIYVLSIYYTSTAFICLPFFNFDRYGIISRCLRRSKAFCGGLCRSCSLSVGLGNAEMRWQIWGLSQ